MNIQLIYSWKDTWVFFKWFDKLDSNGQAGVKEEFNVISQCLFELYSEARNQGNVNGDSKITKEAVKYGAAKCINPETLKVIKNFLPAKKSD